MLLKCHPPYPTGEQTQETSQFSPYFSTAGKVYALFFYKRFKPHVLFERLEIFSRQRQCTVKGISLVIPLPSSMSAMTCCTTNFLSSSEKYFKFGSRIASSKRKNS